MRLHRTYPLLAISLGVILWADNSAAQSVITEIDGCNFQTGVLTSGCIPRFIGHLIQVVFGFIGAIFILNIMVAGYQMAIGSLSGDKGKAKDRIFNSIIGFIVTVCAYLILNTILTVVLA